QKCVFFAEDVGSNCGA
nr:Chain A, Amyloid beta fragment with an intramolecular disulfide bond at positions 17 and 28 [Homo sapiens]